MSTFLARAFVTLCFIGIALFVGGAWLTSEAMMDAGVVLFFVSGVPGALFVPLVMAEAVQTARLADHGRQPQRGR
jgi:hypothetical protein